jgi:hypothetical protein
MKVKKVPSWSESPRLWENEGQKNAFMERKHGMWEHEGQKSAFAAY